MTLDLGADDTTDEALVARWLEGDERAASQLVARHAPALSRYAASLGAAEEAEELVQDTFVRAFGSLQDFRGSSALRTWLFTILRRLVIDRRRLEARRREDEPLPETVPDSDYGALDRLVAAETSSRVAAAVERLTHLQREVFQLRVSEGLSYREIAALVGSTEGAARVHYHNALRALKEALDD